MIERNEKMGQLLKIALLYGRKLQSKQTGYLHYYYGFSEQEPHLPIPIVENFLFALVLLRSRSVEQVNEAKEMLVKLLHFQNKETEGHQTGNFPIYLHDYPACKDRWISVQVAAIIYWILKSFHLVLGQELKRGLEESLILAIKHALKNHDEKPAPYHIAIKIACTALAAGRILQQSDLEEEGARLLDKLSLQQDHSIWYCPATIGVMLASLLMVYPRLSESPWHGFWQFIEKTWHAHACAYVGPALKEWQQGGEPQVTLYDLFMGYFSANFSSRSLKETPAHLEAVLIPVNEDHFQEPVYPLQLEGSIDGQKWVVFQNERMAYFVIESGVAERQLNVEKGFHLFRMVWGDQQRTHTLVLQGGNSKRFTFNCNSKEIVFSFELDPPLALEEREKCRDIAFYLDSHEGLSFLVSGHQSSTFRLEDTISISSEGQTFALKFDLEEGEGKFLGHRMLGNRPSQVGTKGGLRFDAYDWQLFLRTVSRNEACLIKATLQI